MIWRLAFKQDKKKYNIRLTTAHLLKELNDPSSEAFPCPQKQLGPGLIFGYSKVGYGALGV